MQLMCYIKDIVLDIGLIVPFMWIFSEVPCVGHLLSYSHAVAPQAVLSLKEIMCCSWRWVGVAPNPKDFGLLLAQEVRMIQPKMERNSHLHEVEVFQVQHPLCLQEKGEYSFSNWLNFGTSPTDWISAGSSSSSAQPFKPVDLASIVLPFCSVSFVQWPYMFVFFFFLFKVFRKLLVW